MADLPEVFKSQMQERLGPAFNLFTQSLQQPSPVSIRYNGKKLSQTRGKEIPWCTTGRYLDGRPVFTLDPLFHAGAYYVQEASSMLIEQAVTQSIDLKKSITVLDLCAAPGGKSTHLLSLLSPESLLISNEVIRSRASILIENIEKWGRDNVVVTSNDPADFGRLPECFDLVLLDAPCSGEGLFRKEPEATNEWSPKNVDLCSLRQRRIVGDVWDTLKPGGIMIYSTCTYNDMENIDNVVWLSNQQGAECVSMKLHPSWGIDVIRKSNATGYQCFPHKVHGEGFFFAVIRKPGNPGQRKIRTKDILTAPDRGSAQVIKTWIRNPEGKCLFTHGQQIRMIPDVQKQALNMVLGELHVLQAGTGIGEVMKNKIIPDHGLALSVDRDPGAFPQISMSEEQALAFLRKDVVSPSTTSTGFHLVTFQELGLGWVNVLPNRINNLYPAARRIRMGDLPRRS